MRKVDYSDFTWKKNRLYLGEICWGEILPHPEHKGMWKIRWKGDGEFSTDFWNKARAQDNFVKMAQFLHNMMVDSQETHESSPNKAR
jgi:hypothetical protein